MVHEKKTELRLCFSSGKIQGNIAAFESLKSYSIVDTGRKLNSLYPITPLLANYITPSSGFALVEERYKETFSSLRK